MGYTHYFRVNGELDIATWDVFTKKVKNIIKMAKKDNIIIVGPMGEIGTEPIINSETVALNGQEDDSYETLRINRNSSHNFNFCKTQYRPYDPVVVSILKTLSDLFPNNVKISSDGGDEAFQNCKYIP